MRDEQERIIADLSSEGGRRVARAVTDVIGLAPSKAAAARIAISLAAKALALAAGSVVAAKGLPLSGASFRAVAADLAEDLVEEIGACIPAGYARRQGGARGMN